MSDDPEIPSGGGIPLTDALDLAEVAAASPMVVKTVRIPQAVDGAIAAAAADAGITPSVWIRRAIEAALVVREPGELVNIDDVVRAVMALPRAGRPGAATGRDQAAREVITTTDGPPTPRR